jgi:hypothetical protein
VAKQSQQGVHHSAQHLQGTALRCGAGLASRASRSARRLGCALHCRRAVALQHVPFRCSEALDQCRAHGSQDHFKALGQTVADTKLEHVRAQMAAFKQGLEGFALKHRRASSAPWPFMPVFCGVSIAVPAQSAVRCSAETVLTLATTILLPDDHCGSTAACTARTSANPPRRSGRPPQALHAQGESAPVKTAPRPARRRARARSPQRAATEAAAATAGAARRGRMDE